MDDLKHFEARRSHHSGISFLESNTGSLLKPCDFYLWGNRSIAVFGSFQRTSTIPAPGLDSQDGKVYSWSMFSFLGAKSDMLKNAPMFKRLDSKIKAGEIYYINWKTGKKVKEDPRKETETLKTDRFRGGR